MPTDIAAPVKRRREARKQFRLTLGLLGLWLVVCLINVGLLFVDPALAQAVRLFAQN